MKRIFTLLLSLFFLQLQAQEKEYISVGDKAIDFNISTIQGEKIQLSELYKKNPVVLIVLRGWPGYQCPICTRQVGGLVDVANELAAYEARVLFIYPGPSEQLQQHANEFRGEFDLPGHFYFTLDPDYDVVNKYNLRWDAPNETAYPSTFVIDKNGEVVFSKISDTHGGRANTDEVLAALKKTH
jgi:peroxiredoxin